MSHNKKTWILVRSSEYQPGGYLSLGQILVKPFEPSLPLLTEGPLPLLESQIERSHQAKVKISSGSCLNISFKLWADLNVLPIQAHVGTNFTRSKSLEWEFDRLENEITVPNLPFIQALLKTSQVAAQIRRSSIFDFRKRLYMVTGVRHARGAKLVQKEEMSNGGEFDIGANLSTFSVPVDIGASTDITNSHTNSHSFENVSDFVYAYRLCEIHYGKDVYVTQFNKGDTQAATSNSELLEGSEDEDEDEDEGEESSILVEGLSDPDFIGNNVCYEVDTENFEERFISAAGNLKL